MVCYFPLEIMSNRNLMKPSPAKEEPNTRNIVAWPQGYQDSNNNSNDRVNHSGISNNNEKVPEESMRPFLEFWITVSLGSFLWGFLVIKFLQWHQFPFHLYYFQIFLIITCPIILLIFFLHKLDQSLHFKDE